MCLENSLSHSSEILSTVVYKLETIIFILELGRVGEVNIYLSMVVNSSS